VLVRRRGLPNPEHEDNRSRSAEDIPAQFI